jgi:D-alanyl-D-alanine carboxypeptidase
MSIAGNGNIKCESLNRTLYNRNFFLSGYYNGIGKSYLNSQVTGLLAGSLIDPQLLIASMVSDHYTYICVVMNVRASEEEAWEYSIAKTILKEYAGTFSKVEVLSPNKIICEIPVSMGKEHDAVVVSPDQSFSFYLTNDVDPETEFSYTYELTAESLEAPVTEGTEVGEIFLYRGDQLVGNAKLLVRANVSRSMSEYYQGQARSIVMGKTFLKALAILVLLSLVYVIITSIIRGQKMKRARKFYKS